jgi:hypothetical protein
MYFPLPLDLYLGLGTSDSVKGNIYNEGFPGYLIKSYFCHPAVATGRWQQLLPFTIPNLVTYLGPTNSDLVKGNVLY